MLAWLNLQCASWINCNTNSTAIYTAHYGGASAALTAMAPKLWVKPRSHNCWDRIVVVKFLEQQSLANFQMQHCNVISYVENCGHCSTKKYSTIMQVAIPADKNKKWNKYNERRKNLLSVTIYWHHQIAPFEVTTCKQSLSIQGRRGGAGHWQWSLHLCWWQHINQEGRPLILWKGQN